MSQPNPQWNVHFPIYQSEDYDLAFPDMPYPVGIKSTFPEELIRRIVAAVLSFQLRNKSIDYTYKRYMHEIRYEVDDGSRLDVRISDAIELCCGHFTNLLYYLTGTEGKGLGNIVCEWTMMRVPHSIKQLSSVANRGNLYESCALARTVLEQIAWASAIDDLIDAKAISRVRAEGSIPVLKRKMAFAGTLYGWLSSHTHWRYDGHIKAMSFTEEGMSTTLQSSRFKAISLTVALLLLASATFTLRSLRRDAVSTVLGMQPEARLRPGKRLGESGTSLGVLFEPHAGSSVAQIRSLLALSLPLALVDEIRNAGFGDEDIDLLWHMADDLRQTAAAS